MIAIIKKESDDTHIYFKLFVWNGKMYVSKDVVFIFWCDSYNNEENETIQRLVSKHNITRYQVI